jgi:tetratricopeptide (TPR) repeat protein
MKITMKNKYSLLLLLAMILPLVPGCKDFLELKPISQGSAANFYKTPNDFNTAVLGAYSTLQTRGMYNSMWLFADERSDDTEQEAYAGILQTEGDFDQFSLITTNSYLSDNWNNHYQCINRSNAIIGRIGSVNFTSEALKNQYLGEALFLRGLAYFNLVRIYGDVPLVSKEISSEEAYTFKRTPADEVYAAIVSDLTQAGGLLPPSYSGNNIGRATGGAAKSLLGKVYLTRKQYSEAAGVLKEVIDGEQYILLPSYADVFSVENANHKESIFEVQYKANSQNRGSPFATLFTPRTGNAGIILTGQGATQGYNRPTQDMINAYQTGDLRKEASLSATWTDGARVNNDPYIKKYLSRQSNTLDGEANWIVLRYADVLLMYAEALSELGRTAEALPFLNQVRARAGLAPLEGLDQGQLRLALEQERRVELAFEGHRWFDLLRTGRAIEVMNSKGFNITSRDLLYPIPQSQIDINPELKQNDGY